MFRALLGARVGGPAFLPRGARLRTGVCGARAMAWHRLALAPDAAGHRPGIYGHRGRWLAGADDLRRAGHVRRVPRLGRLVDRTDGGPATDLAGAGVADVDLDAVRIDDARLVVVRGLNELDLRVGGAEHVEAADRGSRSAGSRDDLLADGPLFALPARRDAGETRAGIVARLVVGVGGLSSSVGVSVAQGAETLAPVLARAAGRREQDRQRPRGAA